VTRRVIEHSARTDAASDVPGEPYRPSAAAIGDLSERELEVLHLMARGLSNPEIAAELFDSSTTVKTHVSHILTKLGVRDRVQAVVVAYETGFVGRGAG
jgi:DNA-binding NarL/FixJ family response regulator